MDLPSTTRTIYDTNAPSWSRHERTLLSDFTARPFVLEALGPLEGAHVLDLGCGEGYVARRLAAVAGALAVLVVSLSPAMVAPARRAIPAGSRCSFAFEAGDAADFAAFPRERFDRVMAVFLFNYLTRAQMTTILRAALSRL